MSLNQTKNDKTMMMNYSTQQHSMTQQSVAAKYSEEDYSNYIDSSDLVVEYYKKTKVTGLESQFLKIENWLDREIASDEDNVPMVIVANEGVGKKTLLVKWMEFHQQNDNQKQPDIILPHFATTGGNNSNYYFAIYQYLIKLREILDVNQKVELLEEKLRSFFAYWLEVCHNSIERQVIDDKPNIYNRIILVIEGIDHFVDQETGQEAAVAFWLPRFFPKNVRVICTAEKNSEALNYFQRIGIDPLYITVDQNIIIEQINNHTSQELLINEETKNKHQEILNSYPENVKINIFVATFLSFFLPKECEIITKGYIEDEVIDKIFNNIDYEKLKNLSNNKEQFDFMIDLYKQSGLISVDSLITTLKICCLSQKGLTLMEIQKISNINDDEWKLFLLCFKDYFIYYKDLWILNSDPLKKYVTEFYLNDPNEIKRIHLQIADTLDKYQQNSIRKLEEQTFHLYKCQSEQGFFQLKEIISNIENFLLLFNPNNKYDLCRYWQALDGPFDPVIEYNKAIEGFEMHYHPNPEDVFRIIVQISRFLKEFSDFETYYTPQFRHPPIKGTLDELKDIGLLGELMQLSIYYNKDFIAGDGEDEKNINEKQEQYLKELQEDFQKAEKDKAYQKKIIDNAVRKLKYKGKDEGLISIEESDLSKIEKSRRKKQYLRDKLKDKAEKIKEQNNETLVWNVKKKNNNGQSHNNVIKHILNEIEQLNVDITVNRQKFRDSYVQQLNNIMNEDDQQKQQETRQENSKNQGEKDKKVAKNQANAEAEQQVLQKKLQNEKEITEKFIDMHKNDPEFNQKGQGNKFNNDGDNKKKLIHHSQLKEYYNLKQSDQTTNYYYKRWIWIQYPWACSSLKQNFSAKMHQCFSSATKYMTVNEEKKFTKQALQIAIEAKLKKQSMYQKKSMGGDQSSIIKANMSRISHNSSLPQIKNPYHNRSQTQNQMQTSLGKSQTLSRIDPYENSDMPSRIKGYNKSVTNKRNNDSVQFFITEEYTAIPNINREVEKAQGSPQKGNKKVEKLLNEQSMVQDTQRILQKQKKFKEKSQLFDPMPSLNESRKLDSVLPRLKQNISGHNNREIYLLEQQSFDMKSQLNCLISENQKMAKSLKHLKKVEENQKDNIDGNSVYQARKRIEDLTKKIAETQYNYYFCVLQIERLKTIQRISDENKKQNQEWIRYLNYLLSNLNKMIKWEIEGIKKCQKETRELRKINDEYLKAFDEKMENHDTLIQKIKSNLEYKRHLDGMFGRSDTVIERSAFQQIEKMKNDQFNQDVQRKQKERQDKNQNKQRDVVLQLEEQKQEFEKLSQVIQIEDFDYQKCNEFQEFLAAQEKEADLQSILLERDDQIYDLQRILDEKENKLMILKKAHNQNLTKEQSREYQRSETSSRSKTKRIKKQNKENISIQDQSANNNEQEQQQQQQNETQNNNNNENTQDQQQQQQQQQEPEKQQSQLNVEENKENQDKNEQQQQQSQQQLQENNNTQNQENNQENTTTNNNTNNNEQQQQQQQDQQQEQQQKQNTEENEDEDEEDEIYEDQETEVSEQEDTEIPEGLDQQHIYYENKIQQNNRLEQTRLALIGIIQTVQKKLSLKQSSNIKDTMNFNSDDIISILQEKIEVIKGSLNDKTDDDKAFDKFMENDFKKNVVYMEIVDNVSEYGYDQEELGDQAFPESSDNDL